MIELSQKSRSGDLSSEELHSYLSSIYYTKKLLRVFLSNLKQSNKTTLLLLFELLERNLKNTDLAEEQEKTLWQRRREALRRINPKLDIRYRADHFSRSQVIEDECYVKIKEFILTRLTGEDVTLNNIADICVRMVDFEKKLDDPFMEVLTSALDRIDGDSIDDRYMGSILSKALLVMKRLRTHKLVTFRVASLDYSVPAASSRKD